LGHTGVYGTCVCRYTYRRATSCHKLKYQEWYITLLVYNWLCLLSFFTVLRLGIVSSPSAARLAGVWLVKAVETIDEI
jgi:hypothetical protein